MDALTQARPPRRQLLSAPFVRAMLAGHSALGIAFAALIYIVCFSGAVLVFLNDWQRWEQPDTPLLVAVTPEQVNSALATIHAQARGEGSAHDIYLAGPGPTNPRFAGYYHDDDTGVEGERFLDAEGYLDAPIEAPWSEFIAELHTSLHLPRTWGLLIVGLTGVALLSSLISGVLSHPRVFKDAFAFRWGGSRRLGEADLHNRIGVWGLPFHVAVSLTGALLGLSTLIIGLLAFAAYDGNSEKAFAAILGPMAGADRSPAPLPDLAAMIRQVQAQAPTAQFVSANIKEIGTAGQIVHLGMKVPGYLPMANMYYFDGAGRFLGDGGLETGTVGQQVLGALQPLHFGWFGGVPVRLAYGLLGLALTYIAYNGVTIWLVRRREKGRPAPQLEKIWPALGWSQPLAFGITAGASLILGDAPLLAIYGAAVAATLTVALMAGSGAVVARLLRLASAAVLLAVAAVHMAVWMGQVTDPMAHWINAALVAGAVVIALPVLTRAPRQG
ncbi:PepSY-associated TM helix domain-containing protein [Xanthobacter sp. AM11]|uniref:PepSY-associated TM helix domain-containing protein n=1 Tax=Xanthobacter sp. AM11 TaxID=3380643 RepID=UPI0039BFABB1